MQLIFFFESFFPFFAVSSSCLQYSIFCFVTMKQRDLVEMNDGQSSGNYCKITIFELIWVGFSSAVFLGAIWRFLCISFSMESIVSCVISPFLLWKLYNDYGTFQNSKVGTNIGPTLIKISLLCTSSVSFSVKFRFKKS